MPLPWLAPAIAGGASLIGGLFNSGSQRRQNLQSQAFSREMYQQQRDDGINFWNMQNDYNSPQAQMNRFQEAGLNPNLIYGQGNSGNAGAIPTPDVQSAQFKSPESGNAISSAGLSAINAMYDLEIKQASYDNMKRQGNVIAMDAALRAAQADNSSFDARLKKKLENNSLQVAEENLRALQTNTNFQLSEWERRDATTNMSLDESFSRIVKNRVDTDKARQIISNARKDGTLKQLEIELRKIGMDSRDPFYARMIARTVNQYLKNN